MTEVQNYSLLYLESMLQSLCKDLYLLIAELDEPSSFGFKHIDLEDGSQIDVERLVMAYYNIQSAEKHINWFRFLADGE